MEQENTIHDILSQREEFLVIGLTGRMGSGCSKVAQVLATPYEKMDFPHPKPQTGLRSLPEEERVTRIIAEYAESHWIKFDVIQAGAIIATFILNDDNCFIKDLASRLSAQEENKEEIEIKQRADFRKKVLSKIYESVLEFYSATFDLNTSFDNAYCIQQEKLLTETLTVLFKQFKQDHPPKFKVSEFVGTCEQLFFNACEDILPEKSDDWNKVVDAMNWLYRSAPQEYPHIHRRKYFG